MVDNNCLFPPPTPTRKQENAIHWRNVLFNTGGNQTKWSFDTIVSSLSKYFNSRSRIKTIYFRSISDKRLIARNFKWSHIIFLLQKFANMCVIRFPKMD
jgi:ascorbate-specific PTS system EIIC-type component UlaA